MIKNTRQALALSAVLAATVLTGGAAILGIAHTPSTHLQAAPAAIVQPVQPAAQSFGEEAD
jgi:hypothetical protein